MIETSVDDYVLNVSNTFGSVQKYPFLNLTDRFIISCVSDAYSPMHTPDACPDAHPRRTPPMHTPDAYPDAYPEANPPRGVP